MSSPPPPAQKSRARPTIRMLRQMSEERVFHREKDYTVLRRFKKTEYEADELPLAEFSCGRGVRLITLYPWPRSLAWHHGDKKPPAAMYRVIDRYGAELAFRRGEWVSRWEDLGLRNFYIEHLLFHEIGHHVDWYSRDWSKANHRILEETADQYAFSMTTKRSIAYNAKQAVPPNA